MSHTPNRCTCTMTDPKTWFYYGSAAEPGSQWELDPECPEHGQPHRWCETCEVHVPVRDEFDDQIGYEEQARDVHVIALDCGHDLVTDLPRRYYSAFGA